MAYLTQAEAAVYSDVIGGLSATKAAALLQVASDQTDAYCGRTFDTALETLPASVAMAVALWAEELADGNDAGKDTIEEDIGDYRVKYSDSAGEGKIQYACPTVVANLLAPYRILVVG